MKINNVTTAIYLDTRRPKKDKTFPIKLRITFNRKAKLYKTSYSLTEKDFDKMTTTNNPKGNLKDTKLDLANLESEVSELIKNFPSFSFDVFEEKYYSAPGDAADLFYQFKSKIKRLENENKIGNASAYTCAYNSFQKYHPRTSLDINSITPPVIKGL